MLLPRLSRVWSLATKADSESSSSRWAGAWVLRPFLFLPLFIQVPRRGLLGSSAHERMRPGRVHPASASGSVGCRGGLGWLLED